MKNKWVEKSLVAILGVSMGVVGVTYLHNRQSYHDFFSRFYHKQTKVVPIETKLMASAKALRGGTEQDITTACNLVVSDLHFIGGNDISLERKANFLRNFINTNCVYWDGYTTQDYRTLIKSKTGYSDFKVIERNHTEEFVGDY